MWGLQRATRPPNDEHPLRRVAPSDSMLLLHLVPSASVRPLSQRTGDDAREREHHSQTEKTALEAERKLLLDPSDCQEDKVKCGKARPYRSLYVIPSQLTRLWRSAAQWKSSTRGIWADLAN